MFDYSNNTAHGWTCKESPALPVVGIASIVLTRGNCVLLIALLRP